MNPVICPFCSAALPAHEVKGGWCEACGKAIPHFAVSAASRAQESIVQKDAGTAGGRTGLIVGMLVGAVAFAALMAGPLRSTGDALAYGAGVAIVLGAAVAGRAAGGVFAAHRGQFG
jgi:hypothetical protein